MPPLTVLGFGCAGLLGRASRKESEIAVKTALDSGITFFDTARSYGYGESEGLLGELLQGERHRLAICTKFGILPARPNWRSRLIPMARSAVKMFPGLRKAAQKQAGTQLTKGQFSVATLSTSLDTSLTRLRTDYVDILLMHAAPESVLAQDDLLEALGRLVESGKVRMAGISADLPVISRYFKERPAALTTAQFALNTSVIGFAKETARNGDLLLVANHPYGGPGGVTATRAAIAVMGHSETLSKELREKLIDGAADPQMLPELLFHLLLDGTGVSAVVPAMMQVKHIHSNVRAVTECRFSSEELKAMRELLANSGSWASTGS
jgi:aryl-alcohol dehydrogenase-like predicted oxidoreductase